MHYRYFTLEQRDCLERAMRDTIAGPAELARALEQLRAPDFGTCAACGGEIPYARLIDHPDATRCAACAAKSRPSR